MADLASSHKIELASSIRFRSLDVPVSSFGLVFFGKVFFGGLGVAAGLEGGFDRIFDVTEGSVSEVSVLDATDSIAS